MAGLTNRRFEAASITVVCFRCEENTSADLFPDTELFIQQDIALGTFQSREDAFEAGVALLKTRRELMNRLSGSRRRLEEGEYIEYDDEGLRQFFEPLIARAEGEPQRSRNSHTNQIQRVLVMNAIFHA